MATTSENAKKTEKQKMLDGEPYDTRDPDLIERHHLCREVLARYNAMSSRDAGGRRELLIQLFGSVGDGVWIEPPFFCDYGDGISIGDGSFVNFNCVMLDGAPIEIGEAVLIGPAVQIYTASHPTDPDERIISDPEGLRYLTVSKPVRIGDRAWIGGGAILMPGVEIGPGATVGAGAVVTQSVPPNAFAAGNPCRVIERR